MTIVEMGFEAAAASDAAAHDKAAALEQQRIELSGSENQQSLALQARVEEATAALKRECAQEVAKLKAKPNSVSQGRLGHKDGAQRCRDPLRIAHMYTSKAGA